MGLFFKKNPKRHSAPSRVERCLLLKKYPVEIHRAPRRKQTSLVVEPRGQILIKCALSTSHKEIEKLVISHEDWLKGHLKRAVEYQQRFPLKKFIAGETYSLQGSLYTLQIALAKGRKWRVETTGTTLKVEVPKDFKARYPTPAQLRMAGLEEIRSFYKTTGAQVLSERIAFWATKSGLIPARVSFRSQKTLWGSCSSKGYISLNWKMVAFPERIYDYILVHELCHLRHQDHSPRFWSLVESLIPDYKERRLWLRKNQNLVDFLSK